MKNLIVLLLPAILLTGCWTISEGEHTAYITTAQKVGLIWKTGRVYTKTDLSASNEDRFCVEDEGVFNQLVELARSGEKVTLILHNEMIRAPWRCGREGSTIDRIE